MADDTPLPAPPTTGLRSIDSDQEFFHGLTLHGAEVAAQITEASVPEERRYALRVVQGEADIQMPAADARRLRDLLNVATARGFL